MNTKTYATNLSDREWLLLEPLVPAPKAGGRPATIPRRSLLDAMFYLVRTGCQWPMLPHDFPKWKTVYHYWRLWRMDGTWETIHRTLHAAVRQKAGRNPQPSAGIVDSQSVKTTSIGGPERGFDGGKKVKGRKRHLLVDTQGLVIRACVHSAALTEAQGLKLLLTPLHEQLPRLQRIWADGGYKEKVGDWVQSTFGWTFEIVRHPWTGRKGVWALPDQAIDWETVKPKGFHVLPRRWVVERTFGWQSQNRRLGKDYEFLPRTSESVIYVAMIRLMLQRLAKE